LSLGDALLTATAYDEAKVTYEQAALRDKTGVAALIGLGRVALRQHRPQEAEPQFQAALALSPANIAARNGIAVAYDFEGRHAEAEALYRDMLREHPDNNTARINLGLSLAFQDRYSESVDTLLDASSAPNAPVEARHNLALAYGMGGNIGAAEEIARIDLNATAVQGNTEFYREYGTHALPVVVKEKP
ncbi:MAG TPA: tetratricopeptide repeat protein, partial [Patescibacteria group bacterium]|nr:tetratricopeptide repeat protein [Patescibacteria group bacterium]